MHLGGAAELQPSAEQIFSPYDPDARYSSERETDWVGYKAQLTETCSPACAGPHLIINVEITPATTPDTTWSRSCMSRWNGVACCRQSIW